MILIFEGHDRSGKTTIAEAVAKRFDTEPFVANSKECFTDKGVFTKDSSNIALFNYHIAAYASNLIKRGKISKPIIIYRSFLSELVYSELLERNTDLDVTERTDALFNSVNAIIILCKNNKIEHNDIFLSNSLVEKSKVLFDTYKLKTECDIIEIDTTEGNVPEYVNRIAKHIETNRIAKHIESRD